MPPTFLTPTQELTYRKVYDYLTGSALFKAQMEIAADEPAFTLTHGSAKIEVEVLPWEVHPWEAGDLAIVRALSCVTVESEITTELMRYLLTENARMRFGAFQLGSQGEVLFCDSVLGGENMDLMELQTCILSVVTIADTYDDWIVDRFSGRRGANLNASAHRRRHSDLALGELGGDRLPED